ncbi:severin-like isoform X2 [Mytilus edulis]|uniref:severin-like isoform X2 n=1 Tax=Mytilus edulis TaxID=6550 RepID=UPI0039EE8915
MANVDAAFRVIDPRSKKSVFHIWRIEKMNVVSVPKEQYGNFYKGDSYIVLSMKEIKGVFDVHIHFWLGSDTTQDEAGVAAYKTVELDDYMGGDQFNTEKWKDMNLNCFELFQTKRRH